ncbi:MAG: hypothetical protein GY795_32035 [Desulfobacterales bacterium]|nr:hypothetical protein [Desulfobacterales bacterium]
MKEEKNKLYHKTEKEIFKSNFQILLKIIFFFILTFVGFPYNHSELFSETLNRRAQRLFIEGKSSFNQGNLSQALNYWKKALNIYGDH